MLRCYQQKEKKPLQTCNQGTKQKGKEFTELLGSIPMLFEWNVMDSMSDTCGSSIMSSIPGLVMYTPTCKYRITQI